MTTWRLLGILALALTVARPAAAQSLVYDPSRSRVENAMKFVADELEAARAPQQESIERLLGALSSDIPDPDRTIDLGEPLGNRSLRDLHANGVAMRLESARQWSRILQRAVTLSGRLAENHRRREFCTSPAERTKAALAGLATQRQEVRDELTQAHGLGRYGEMHPEISGRREEIWILSGDILTQIARLGCVREAQ